MRQRDLAAQLGVREETLAMWERGRATPRVRQYAAIISFLGHDPRPAGEELSDRVNAARRRLGLTQRDIAGQLELDQGTVADIERGRRRVSRRVLRAVSLLLRRGPFG